jgi:putative ABC transport system permease protein
VDIRPIFSALLRNRTGALLVALQVAITLAVVVNAAFIIRDRIATMSRSTGLDEAHLFKIMSYPFAPDYDAKGAILRDLETLRGVPGVRAAGTINTLPGSQSGWSSGWVLEAGTTEPTFNSAYYAVDEQGLEALGIELVAGRWFRSDEVVDVGVVGMVDWPESIVVTQSFAERLFPGQPVVGKVLHTPEGDQSTIVGVVRQMTQPWPDSDEWEDSTLLPGRFLVPATVYVARVEEDEDPAVILPEAEKALQEAGSGRVLLQAQTHEQVLAETFAEDRATTNILWTVIALLVAVTGLGIVGLASFNVRLRTKQIGTRRALGATRGDILRHFMLENALITGIGVVIGTVLTFGLNWWLAQHYELPRLNPGWVPLGMLALLFLGQLAVLAPARRASLVPPAVATRTV